MQGFCRIAKWSENARTFGSTTLCLRAGSSHKFKIYCSDDGGFSESTDRGSQIEFDTTRDPELLVFLVESGWAQRVPYSELDKLVTGLS